MAKFAVREALEVDELLNTTTASSISYSYSTTEEPAAEIGVEEGRLYITRDTHKQAWFWSETWQEKEREAEEDLREGRFKTFQNMDDFLAFLHSQDE